MKIKLDENMPAGLLQSLAALGHDVDTVPAEGLTGSGDPGVWIQSQKAGRFLITQDLDFSDLRAFAPGTHQGILLIRLRWPSRRVLRDRVVAIFQAEDVEAWHGAFVVSTDSKLRVHLPRKTE